LKLSTKAAKLLSVVALAVAAFIVLGYLAVRSSFHEDYARFESVKVGMSEGDVRRLLGEPSKVYEKATAPENYYIEGYSFKRRPITNKVLIYVASEPIAYVYFDDNDKVEETYVGGS
jgi:outer membrane protein assembly factor BamE (lipoprotein component of BamABCDE complex)